MELRLIAIIRLIEHPVQVIDLAFAEAVPTQFNIHYIHRAASCHIRSGCPMCMRVCRPIAVLHVCMCVCNIYNK